MKKVIFAVFLLFVFYARTQTLELVVQNSQEEIAYDVNVYLNKKHIGSIDSSIFTLQVKVYDTLLLEGAFYKSREVVLTPEYFVSENFTMTILLEFDHQEIEEVIVTSDKIKPFFDIENHFVVDYYPMDDLCYFLIKKKNSYSINLNRGDLNLLSRELPFKAESLYLDAFGNFHIVSADSAYQIWIGEDKINWLNPVSRIFFEEQIKPIIAKSETSVFREQYIRNDKGCLVQEVRKDTVIHQYYSEDKIGYRLAAEQRQKIISMYYSRVPLHENIIELGVWDGNLVALAAHYTIMEEIGWYKAALDNVIPCYSIGQVNHITIVDFFKDSVSLIDKTTGLFIDQYKLNFVEKATVYYDFFNDVIYLRNKDIRSDQFFQLDLTNKRAAMLPTIEGITFGRNIRFSGDWVYFMVQEDSGFNKVVRQLIR